MDGKRVKSGIVGLDKLIGGGFLKGSMIDLAGSEGTFKSTFGLQFAVEGIKNGEKVVYLSFEEPKTGFERNAQMLGWQKEFSKIDFKVLDTDELFEDIRGESLKGNDITEALAARLLREIDSPDRVIIDTLTTIAVYGTRTTLRPTAGQHYDYLTPSGGDVRSMLYHIVDKLRSKNITALLLAESGEGALYMPEEILKYVSDVKIELKKTTLGTEAPRTITLHKVRYTAHPLDEMVLKLGKTGLEVKSLA